jgi:hypothetical protein
MASKSSQDGRRRAENLDVVRYVESARASWRVRVALAMGRQNKRPPTISVSGLEMRSRLSRSSGERSDPTDLHRVPRRAAARRLKTFGCEPRGDGLPAEPLGA